MKNSVVQITRELRINMKNLIMTLSMRNLRSNLDVVLELLQNIFNLERKSSTCKKQEELQFLKNEQYNEKFKSVKKVRSI